MTRKRLSPIRTARVAYTTLTSFPRRPPRRSNSILCSSLPFATGLSLLLRGGLCQPTALLWPPQSSSKQDTQLVQNKQRNHLNEHRDRVDSRQRSSDDRNHQIGVAAVLAELLDADDPKPGNGENRQRQLEDQAEGDLRHREEAVVLAGAQLDVELAVVEVEQEVERRRDDDEVGEGDPGQEEEREEQQDRQDHPPLGLAEGGQDVGVELP